MPPAAALAVHDWLVEPAQARRIRAEDRVAVVALLRQNYLAAFLGAGFDTRALGLFDALEPAERERVLDEATASRVMIDGITMDPQVGRMVRRHLSVAAPRRQMGV